MLPIIDSLAMTTTTSIPAVIAAITGTDPALTAAGFYAIGLTAAAAMLLAGKPWQRAR